MGQTVLFLTCLLVVPIVGGSLWGTTHSYSYHHHVNKCAPSQRRKTMGRIQCVGRDDPSLSFADKKGKAVGPVGRGKKLIPENSNPAVGRARPPENPFDKDPLNPDSRPGIFDDAEEDKKRKKAQESPQDGKKYPLSDKDKEKDKETHSSLFEGNSDERKELFARINSFILVAVLLVCCYTGYLINTNRIRYLPESAAVMLIGFLIGWVLKAFQLEREQELLTFDSDLFFNVLLPPIIFEAGFTLKRRHFMSSLGTIMLFAIVGTFVSSLTVGIGCFALSRYTGFQGLDTEEDQKLTFLVCLMFGSLISSIDPVATLSILGSPRFRTNPTFYAVVFGESVLNDAMAMALFGSIAKMIHSKSHNKSLLAATGIVISDFTLDFILSLVVGLVCGGVCSVVCKHSSFLKNFPHYEIGITFMCAYFSYSLSQLLDLSGIVSLFFCGVMLSHYNLYNLSEGAQVSAKLTFKTMAFVAESFVFLYLGIVAAVSIGEKTSTWNFGFIGISMAGCLVGRAMNVFPMAYLSNRCTPTRKRLDCKKQVMMWLSGLRGAISFALAMTIPCPEGNEACEQNVRVIITTTIFIIFFTTIFLGSTIEPLALSLGAVERPVTDDAEEAAEMGAAGEGVNESRLVGPLGTQGNFGQTSPGGGGGNLVEAEPLCRGTSISIGRSSYNDPAACRHANCPGNVTAAQDTTVGGHLGPPAGHAAAGAGGHGLHAPHAHHAHHVRAPSPDAHLRHSGVASTFGIENETPLGVGTPSIPLPAHMIAEQKNLQHASPVDSRHDVTGTSAAVPASSDATQQHHYPVATLPAQHPGAEGGGGGAAAQQRESRSEGARSSHHSVAFSILSPEHHLRGGRGERQAEGGEAAEGERGSSSGGPSRDRAAGRMSRLSSYASSSGSPRPLTHRLFSHFDRHVLQNFFGGQYTAQQQAEQQQRLLQTQAGGAGQGGQRQVVHRSSAPANRPTSGTPSGGAASRPSPRRPSGEARGSLPAPARASPAAARSSPQMQIVPPSQEHHAETRAMPGGLSSVALKPPVAGGGGGGGGSGGQSISSVYTLSGESTNNDEKTAAAPTQPPSGGAERGENASSRRSSPSRDPPSRGATGS
uniref:Sodium/hydrogen exchanger n=1 Tax=Chromera velia CCMP2878 TaxID=1169474 RepID=A0A0G4FPJ5_9ALVE|eukprot:Cvel_18118.t1-p1 / transcript=Cvel_18118.t1 / gene=Cvel_18118 / organism=Chromera_velia_CCMP2878 / gene_product=Sodium/hydrogen exchanger 6, putative / transcript_product=Sodium/hydrogen exchanger 6, putative / location=Cvel_scaffold1486:14372-20156(+) / protein_length=1100 / sequence_SO=supercontig / SO=protein_coding / is_pseudo=false